MFENPKKINFSILSIILLSSCQSNYEVINEIPDFAIDENIKFEKYLSNQLEQNLEDSPILLHFLEIKNLIKILHQTVLNHLKLRNLNSRRI